MVFLAGPMVLAAAGAANEIAKETSGVDVFPNEMGGNDEGEPDCQSISMMFTKYAMVAGIGFTASGVLTIQHPLGSALLTGM